MRRVTSLKDEKEESARRAFVLAGGAVLMTLAVDLFVLVEAARKGTATGVFTRDVRTVIVEAHTRPPFYAGWVSQLNFMAWAAAAALSAAVAYVQAARRGWMLGFALLSRVHWRDPLTGLFVAGGICLAVSITIDQLSPHIFLTEDSFKLLGTLLWLAIPVLCLARVRDRIAVTVAPAD